MSDDNQVPQRAPLAYKFQVTAHNGQGVTTHNITGISRYGAVDGIMWFWQPYMVNELVGTYQECVRLCIPLHSLISVVCMGIRVQ